MKSLVGFVFFVFLVGFFEVEVSPLNIVQDGVEGDDLKPNYTSINWNVSYRSIGNPKESYTWLVQGYYQLVNVIVDLILPDALPDEIFTIEPGETIWSHATNCIWAYRRLFVFIILLLVQIFFLIGSNAKELCSCVFFCTQCSTSTTFNPNTKFKKWLWFTWIYSILFFLLLTLVMANQTNQNMDDGFDTVILTLDDTIVDVEAFVDTTVKQLEILLLTNFQDYLSFFLSSGERTTMNILADIENIIGSLDFSKTFKDIENNFNFIKPVFDEIETILTDVENIGKTINDDISDLKDMVENMVCDTKECEQLKNLIPSLESIYDGGAGAVNETYAELENLANLGKETVSKGFEEVENLTSIIGGNVLNEGKALGNLTANIAGNVAKDLEIAEGGLTNLTSAIGGEAIEEGKALENLTANIAGNVVKDLEIAGGGLTNLTSAIGGGAMEEEKALENLTANIAGNVVKDLEIAGGGLTNLTSAIGGDAIKEGKALENLTANIAGNVVKDLEKAGGGLTNLTSAIGGKAIEEGKALENLTANIAGNIAKDLEDSEKSLANMTGNLVGGMEDVAGGIGNEIENEGKALKDLTKGVAGEVGDVFKDLGDWTFGSGNQKKKSKEIKKNHITTEASTTQKSKAKNKVESMVSGIGSEIGGLFGGFGGFASPSEDKKKSIKNNTTAMSESTSKIESKNEIENIFGSFGNSVPETDSEVGESTMDLTAHLKEGATNGVQKGADGLANGFNNLFAGLDAYKELKQPSGVNSSNPVRNVETTTVKQVESKTQNSFGGLFGGLENVVSKVEKKVENIGVTPSKELGTTTKAKNSGGIFGGVDGWFSGGNKKPVVVSSTPPVKHLETTTTKSSFGGLFGGLENLASKVTNGVKKTEEKMEDMTSKVAGGIGGTASNAKNEIGGLFGGFGDWSSSDSSKKKNEGKVKVDSKKDETKSNGFNSFFGGTEKTTQKVTNDVKKEKPPSITAKVSNDVGKAVGGVENKISDASKKLFNMGGSFFGYRRKRGIDSDSLKGEFDAIFGTIDRIENYVMNDLKNLNNLTVLLSPITEEIDVVIKEVLSSVEEELRKAAKPIEALFASTLDKIISVEHSILNATNVIKDTQDVVSWFEVYRYHISNFIATVVLISFALLTFGISTRMTYNNVVAKFTYKGGFTLLHLTALLMAATSMIYICAGVTSQKVLCETFDTNYREDNIMRILSKINPAKYGLLLDLNLHKVIIRCHQDRSLYEVAALGKTELNIEKIALGFFDLDAIEKEFKPLLNLNLNFAKYFPLDTIHTIEEDLNFEAFDKILDSPIFKQMDKLEKEFTQIPLIGPVIKKITDKIDSFKDKIMSIKTPVQSANNGYPSFLSNLKTLLVDVEKGVSEMEAKSVNTLQNVIEQLKNTLMSSLMDYVNNRLIHSIQHDVGKCRPISAAFNSTLNSICSRITTPANGHWFSWFMGVSLSILLIVMSRKLDGKLNIIRSGGQIIQSGRDFNERIEPNALELEVKDSKSGGNIDLYYSLESETEQFEDAL